MKTLRNTHLLWAIAALLMMSCGSKNSEEDARLTELKSQIIKVHDEAMAKMGEINRLSKELNTMKDSIADSTAVLNIDAHLADLQKAHDDMMTWMRDFSENYPAGTLMGGSKHDETETQEVHDGLAPTLENLQSELSKIEQNNKDINQSIDKAKNLIEAKQ